jgi:DNA-binding SARP family transcriptional activator
MQGEPAPLLRVYTFGTFELVWHAAPCTAETVWESRTSARTLFKLLLCAPGRQASKGMLAGILWPEVDEDRARESLRSACKVLRKVLRTASGEELLDQRTSGEILRLAEQTRLWIDADAFEELVAQASRATSEEAALPLWEEANALLRGEFFAEDQSAEWAHHRLVKKRQQGLWLARCRMIRHLADLYVRRGQTSLAEEMLEAHLLHFPTDQDALYRLLLLLEQQGCFEQASILYERTRRVLEARGKQPAHHVRVLYEGFQQAVSSRTHTLSSQTERPSPGIALTAAKQTRPALSRGGLQDSERGWAGTIGQVLSLLGTDGRPDTSLDVLRALVEPEEEGTQDMSQLSRRQLLELGIAALISRLAQLDKKRITLIDREELGWVLGKGIADGWKLFLTTANTEVLAVSQLQLALIHQAHPLLYPSTRVYLYAGAYGLLGLALHQQEHHEEALQAYHNAHLAAVATRDSWYVAQSLICQADTYLVLGMYAEALHAIEEALNGLGEIDEEHRRARAHLLGCWADVAMSMKEYSFAQKKLDEATRYLDEVTIIEEFDRTCWLQLAGKNALMAGEYHQAIDYLEEALATNPPHWLVRQAGILTPLAMAYARAQKREQSLLIAQQAIPIIGAVNAPMANTYFLEYVQDDILDRFPCDSKIHAFLREVQQQLPHLPVRVDAL